MLTRSAARKRWLIGGSALAALATCLVATAAMADVNFNPFGTSQVGTQANGQIVLPDDHVIAPYGNRTTFTAQTIGATVSPDGLTVAAQTGGVSSGSSSINILDAATGSIIQQFGGSGVAAPVYSLQGTTLYAAKLGSILKYTVGADGKVTNPASPVVVSLPGSSYPYGLAVSADGSKLYAAFSGTNKLGVIDTATNTLTAQIPVGNAPQDVVIVGNQAFVSNRGGRPAVNGDTTDDSFGTPIVSDPEMGVATTGTVSVVDLGTNAVTKSINVGLQPAAMIVHDGAVFVANTNDDTVSIIDAASGHVTQTFNVDPLPGSTIGASPNAISFTDSTHFLVSVGGDDAVAEFAYDGPHSAVRYLGLIPTDWRPNGVQYDQQLKKVIVSNQQGIGTDGANQTYADKGTVTSFTMPDNATLGTTTGQVFKYNGWDHLSDTQGGDTQGTQGGALPAIPAELGQPSAIKHVFLVVKENRTYDQLFGDLGKGNGNPAYTTYGAQVTPNERSLVNTFTLFDNFYDNGMLSADGHNWLMQADVNDYMEQDAASGWARSYPDVSGDALAYQRDGFLWNAVERAGKTVENYGEKELLSTGTPGTWQQYYADSQILEGKAAGPLPVPLNQWESVSNIPSLNKITNHDYPEWNLEIPDQYRVDVWEQDFKKAEHTGNLPNLTILYLPNDHTGGSPGGTAQVADNDLAFGRVVSDISHSRFWKDSAIFAMEDDSQSGLDHVDGHRAPLWVASPYVNHGVVNDSYYTQVNAIKTIEQILGVQPMNQMDRAAVPMTDAFTNRPDLTPYTVLPNQVPLFPTASAAAQSVPAAAQSAASAWATWYQTDAKPKLTGAHAVQDSVNPAQLNRYDWYTATGWAKPYPGDKQILAPDQVPGRNLPSDFLGGD